MEKGTLGWSLWVAKASVRKNESNNSKKCKNYALDYEKTFKSVKKRMKFSRQLNQFGVSE